MVQAQIPLALQLRDGHELSNFYPGINAAPLQGIHAVLEGEDQQAFVAGGPGMGKTHLLEGAVRLAQRQGIDACLLPASEIIALPPEVVESMEHFALLAVDDTQLFAGHPAWEEALFHLYNRLQQHGGRFIAAAVQAPGGLGLGLPDLATRLAAGPVYRLQSLDEVGLQQLLMAEAARKGLRLEAEVAHFIVMRSERSAASLVSLMDRLDQQALAEKRSLTIPFVKSALGW